MSDTYEVGVGGLVSAIKKSWIKLFIISLILAIVAFFVLSQMEPRYVSEARVLISPIASYQNPAAGRSQEPRVNIDKAAILGQIQVMQSRDIVAKVIDDFGLMNDEKFQKRVSGANSGLLPFGLSQSYEDYSSEIRRELTIDIILEDLQVVSLAQSRVVGVRFHSSDPIRASGVANSIATEYINWQRSEKVLQNHDDSIRLARLISDLKKELSRSEADVAAYRAKKGIFKSSRTDVTLDRQQLTELNGRIISARERRAEMEIKAELIAEMLERDGEVAAAPDNMRSQLIQRLFEQKTRIKRTISELSATLLISHPRIQQLRSELRGMNQQIRDEMRRIVQSAENDAKIARARELSLQKSLDELKHQSTRLDGDEIQLRALEREAKTNRDLLSTYLARFRDAKARKDSAIAPAFASIVSKAHVPTKPYFPKVLPVTMLVFVASFLVGLGFVIIWAVLQGEQNGRNLFRRKSDERRHGNLEANPRDVAPVTSRRDQ